MGSSQVSLEREPVGATTAFRLEVRELELTLGDRVVLDDVELGLAPGEILGILGPNGSGKTSLIRILSGLLEPNRGTVWLDGKALRPSDRSLRARAGIVFQEPSLDAYLSVRDNLRMAAALYGVSGREARKRTDGLLAFMGLADRAEDRVSKLSGGMRRRVELLRALIHGPSILLLDEPTTGLDLVAFDRTWNRLHALRAERELSILTTTHRAAEAQRCDRLVLLDRGRVIACERPGELLARVASDVVEIRATRLEQLVADVREHFGLEARIEDTAAVLEVEGGHELVPRLVEAFAPGRILSVRVRRPSLTDAFFHLTGHVFAAEDSP